MRACKYEGLIDGYVLNKLAENEQREFEEHYFNCPSCFHKMAEREEIVSVLKRNRSIFISQEQPVLEVQRAPGYRRLPSFLSSRQWAMAGTAVLLIVTALIVAAILRNVTPEFVLNGEDTVRGRTLTLISPVIDVHSFPSYFEWTRLGEGTEYRVYVYDGELLWKTTTTENTIFLPQDVRSRMIAGHKYSWQVKAFSKEGTLIAVSSKVQFTINK